MLVEYQVVIINKVIDLTTDSQYPALLPPQYLPGEHEHGWIRVQRAQSQEGHSYIAQKHSAFNFLVSHH